MGSGITTNREKNKSNPLPRTKNSEEKQHSFQNEDHYTGEWVNNKREGNGIYHYNNGDRYIGAWKDDKKHGYGKYHFMSGNTYEGNWQFGKKNGEGKFHFQNGDFYNGNFKNDKLNGRGTYHYYTTGEKYVGFWKNNVIFGKGIRYTSLSSNDNIGSQINKDIKRIVEDWADGKAIKFRGIMSVHDDEEEDILSGRIYSDNDMYKLDEMEKE